MATPLDQPVALMTPEQAEAELAARQAARQATPARVGGPIQMTPEQAEEELAARQAARLGQQTPRQDEGFWRGQILNPIKRGGLDAALTNLLLAHQIGGADTIDNMAALRAQIKSIPESPEMREVGEQKGAWNTAKTILSHPSTIAEATAGFAGNIVPLGAEAIPAGAATGAGIGAGVGALGAGAGAAPGAAAGATIGAGVGINAAMGVSRYSTSVMQQLEEKGIDTSNPEQLRLALTNKELMDPINKQAMIEGGITFGAGEAAAGAGGLASKAISKIAGKVAGRVAGSAVGAGTFTGGEALTQEITKGQISPEQLTQTAIFSAAPGLMETVLGEMRQKIGENIPVSDKAKAAAQDAVARRVAFDSALAHFQAGTEAADAAGIKQAPEGHLVAPTMNEFLAKVKPEGDTSPEEVWQQRYTTLAGDVDKANLRWKLYRAQIDPSLRGDLMTEQAIKDRLVEVDQPEVKRVTDALRQHSLYQQNPEMLEAHLLTLATNAASFGMSLNDYCQNIEVKVSDARGPQLNQVGIRPGEFTWREFNEITLEEMGLTSEEFAPYRAVLSKLDKLTGDQGLSEELSLDDPRYVKIINSELDPTEQAYLGNVYVKLQEKQTRYTELSRKQMELADRHQQDLATVSQIVKGIEENEGPDYQNWSKRSQKAYQAASQKADASLQNLNQVEHQLALMGELGPEGPTLFQHNAEEQPKGFFSKIARAVSNLPETVATTLIRPLLRKQGVNQLELDWVLGEEDVALLAKNARKWTRQELQDFVEKHRVKVEVHKVTAKGDYAADFGLDRSREAINFITSQTNTQGLLQLDELGYQVRVDDQGILRVYNKVDVTQSVNPHGVRNSIIDQENGIAQYAEATALLSRLVAQNNKDTFSSKRGPLPWEDQYTTKGPREGAGIISINLKEERNPILDAPENTDVAEWLTENGYSINPENFEYIDKGNGSAHYQIIGDKINREVGPAFATRFRQLMEKLIRGEEKPQTYNVMEWGHPGHKLGNETNNRVVHLRYTIRNRNGKRYLRIEEIQSDWANDWRKRQDYEKARKALGQVEVPSISIAELKDRLGESDFYDYLSAGVEDNARFTGEELNRFLNDYASFIGAMPDEVSRMVSELRRSLESSRPESELTSEQQAAAKTMRDLEGEFPWPKDPSKNPSAHNPFLDANKGWIQLSLKQALMQAVEEGVDGVELTPGREHYIDRYYGHDSAKGLVSLYDDMIPRVLEKLLKKYGDGEKLTKIGIPSNEFNISWGDLYHEMGIDQTNIGLITKIAELRARVDPNLRDDNVITIKGAYDKILSELNPVEQMVLKNARTKAEEGIVAEGGEGIKFDVSDKLRKFITKEGMSEFEQRRNKKGVNASINKEALKDGRAIITLFNTADASSFPHELAHLWLVLAKKNKLLSEQENDRLNLWLRLKKGDWGTNIHDQAHEKWARGFEKYLRDGVAPSPLLTEVFSKFRAWLKQIYARLKGSPINIKIPADIRAIMDKMFSPLDTNLQPEFQQRLERAGLTSPNALYQGNPDLIPSASSRANPLESNEARGAFNKVLEARELAGYPHSTPTPEVRAVAKLRLQNDRQGELQKYLALANEGKSLGFLDDPTGAAVVQSLLNDLGSTVWSTNKNKDWLVFTRLAHAYENEYSAWSLMGRLAQDPARGGRDFAGVGLEGEELAQAARAPLAPSTKLLMAIDALDEKSRQQVRQLEIGIKEADAQGWAGKSKELNAAKKNIETKYKDVASKIKKTLEYIMGLPGPDIAKLVDVDDTKFIYAMKQVTALKSPMIRKSVEVFKSLHLLGNPATHGANLVATALNIAREGIVQRNVTALLNLITRRMDAPTFAENAVWFKAFILHGLLSKDVIKDTWQAMKQERAINENRVFGGSNPSKLDYSRAAISDRIKPFKWTGIPGLKNLGLGAAIRGVGFGPLTAGDEYLNSAYAFAEAYARAYRQSVTIDGIAKSDQAAIEVNINKLVNNLDHPIWQQSMREAQRGTFREPMKGLMKSIVQMKAKHPMADAALPFVATMTNVVKTIFRASPLGITRLGWKLVNKYTFQRDNPEYYRHEAMLHDAGEQMIALGLVTSMYAYGWDEPDDKDGIPFMTGSDTSDMPGVRPNCVKIGNHQFDFSRIDPVWTIFASMVDGVRAMRKMERGEEPTQAGSEWFTSFKKSMTSKTFMKSLGDIMALVTVENGKPSISGQALAQFSTNYATFFVPAIVTSYYRGSEEQQAEQRVWGEGANYWSRFFRVAEHQVLPWNDGDPDASLEAITEQIASEGREPDAGDHFQLFSKVDFLGQPVTRAALTAPRPVTDIWQRTITDQMARSAMDDRTFTEKIGNVLVRVASPIAVFDLSTREGKAGAVMRIITNWNNQHPDKKIEIAPPAPSFSQIDVEEETEKEGMLPGKRQEYMTPKEYYQFLRLSGSMALDMMPVEDMNQEKPNQMDTQLIAKCLGTARTNVRKMIQAKRPVRE